MSKRYDQRLSFLFNQIGETRPQNKCHRKQKIWTFLKRLCLKRPYYYENCHGLHNESFTSIL
jgi:hypothetical protein